jgi:acyl-CoA synthetase (NDP forming)
MLETAVLFRANATPPPARGIAAVTLSGGEAALLSDVASEIGLDFTPLAEATLARLRPAFPDYAAIDNPVDAWGLGFDPQRFKLIVEALLADPALGTVVFSINASSRRGEDVPYPRAIAETCLDLTTDKRVVFINNSVGNGVNPAVRALLAPAGIPYLSGMRAGLAAVRNLTLLRNVSHAAPIQSAPSAPWPDDEPARFRALTQAGVPMVPTEVVLTREAAVSAAQRLGFPVAIKGVADHLPHKSELQLVRLDLRDAASVVEAFDALSAALARHARGEPRGHVVVQPMAGDGVELIVSIRNDPKLGSFVIVGPGGVLVEIANQASVRRGPVDEDGARAMLHETAAARLLAGVRGKGPFDAAGAARAIAALSRFGAARRDALATLEINPLIVGRESVLGVDILAERQPHTDARALELAPQRR